MKRSAAPSLRADIKRAQFLPQVIKSLPLSERKNEHYSFTETNVSVPPIESGNLASVSVTVTANGNNESLEKVRSNKDVLDIIFAADTTMSENEISDKNISISKEKHVLNIAESKPQLSSNMKPLHIGSSVISPQSNICEDFRETISNCIFCIKDAEEAALFNVVWCKRSSKKHKTWEGDGFLIVRSRSAVLKDLNGKILDRGVGYKIKETESLEEGSKFFIGGKECEIQCRILIEECQSGKYCKCNSTTLNSYQSSLKQPEIHVPVSSHKPC